HDKDGLSPAAFSVVVVDASHNKFHGKSKKGVGMIVPRHSSSDSMGGKFYSILMTSIEEQEQNRDGGDSSRHLHHHKTVDDKAPNLLPVYLNDGPLTVVSSIKHPIMIVEMRNILVDEESKKKKGSPSYILLRENESEIPDMVVKPTFLKRDRILVDISEPLKLFYDPFSGVVYFFSLFGVGMGYPVRKYSVRSITMSSP